MIRMRWWIVGAAMAASLAGCGMQATETTTENGGGTQGAMKSPAGEKDEFNILEFGAVGDGTTLNTAAIQKAIDACAAAGGGKVIVPKGTFKTGPITLAGHLNLHLESGAVVLFSDNRSDYPMMMSNFEGKQAVICQSPLSGENLDHLTISGEGTIDGSGQVWRPAAKSKMTEEEWAKLVASGGVVEKTNVIMRDNGTEIGTQKDKMWWPSQAAMDGQKRLAELRKDTTPPKMEDYKDLRDLLRPPLVMLTGCTNLTLEGCTFTNSPNWTIHLLSCKAVVVKNIQSLNPSYGRNTDGIDIDSCSGVTMTGSTVYSGDDDICIKSGRDEEGRKRGQPSENITIDNCIIGWGHGGVAIGSEMSGGVRNVTVTNCIMRGTNTGLRFKSRRGRGGLVENLTFSNITMYDIKGAAIGFDLFYMEKVSGPQPINAGTPVFRLVSFHNVTCVGSKQGIDIHGLAEMPLSDVTIDHCNLTAEGGAVVENAKNLTLKDVEIHATASPAMEFRNVQGLSLEDTTATAEMALPPTPSTRPAVGTTRPAAARAPRPKPGAREVSPAGAFD